MRIVIDWRKRVLGCLTDLSSVTGRGEARRTYEEKRTAIASSLERMVRRMASANRGPCQW